MPLARIDALLHAQPTEFAAAITDIDAELQRKIDRGGYGDGMWHLPSGKTEAGESVEQAVIREAYEEVGVLVAPADLRCVHAVHVRHSGEEPRVGFFFEATRWAGEPSNREPGKCSAVRWFPFTELPDGIIPYPAAGISAYLTGVPFSVFGWGHETPRPTSPPVQPLRPALTPGLSASNAAR